MKTLKQHIKEKTLEDFEEKFKNIRSKEITSLVSNIEDNAEIINDKKVLLPLKLQFRFFVE